MKWSLVLCAACSAAGGTDQPDATSGTDAVAQIDAPPVMAAPIKVLTVNLKTPLPSDSTVDQRTAIVAQLIMAEQPDVIALQEVTKSASLSNRAEVLAGM